MAGYEGPVEEVRSPAPSTGGSPFCRILVRGGIMRFSSIVSGSLAGLLLVLAKPAREALAHSLDGVLLGLPEAGD